MSDLTKPRTDVPTIGSKIAVMHGTGSFYVGPMVVVEVDAPLQMVTLHPDYWPPRNFVVYRPHRDEPVPLKWNLLEDLSEDERDRLTKGVYVELLASPGIEIERFEVVPEAAITPPTE